VTQAPADNERVSETPAASKPAEAASADDAPDYQRLSGERLIDHWSSLVQRATLLLLQSPETGFVATLQGLDGALLPLIEHDPDRVLLTALHGLGTSRERYCAAHSLLVAIGCHLAATVLGGWGDDELRRLRLAALTMNIGMAALQDRLALQDTTLTPEQRRMVDAHTQRGVDRLRELGVDDADWLAAVRQHHDIGAGVPGGRPRSEEMARLIQRIDRLTAAQSLRRYQQTLPAAAAARSIFKDENNEPDRYAAAAIKALGIYPPGSLVRLANDEIAIVVRRGDTANEPHVASIARDADLRHTMAPRLRDTARSDFAITAGMTHAKLNIRLSLGALLELAV
jgi:hypothetical protein